MSEEANIFVLIDGLGWEWVRSTPFLSTIAPYRRPLDTVLGFSAGAIPSILTGLYPAEHGRMAMFHRAANGDSPFRKFRWLCAMPPAMVENRYVRHALKRMAARMCRLEGYFHIYDVPLRYLPLLDVGEKRDIYRPGGIPGACSIFDLLAAKEVPYRSYSYHQGPDVQLFELAERDIIQRQAQFYFLYLAEVDAFLHVHADDQALSVRTITEYSGRLERLYNAAKRNYRRVRIHVFSDHGMAPTRKRIDIQARLAALPYESPRDYFYLLDSTMARFWFYSDAVREAVGAVLRDCEEGVWLSDERLDLLHARFGDRRYGDQIFLMSEGCVIEPSYMGRIAPNGMHGFDPQAPHSKATLVSSENYGDSVGHITDIFGLMGRYC